MIQIKGLSQQQSIKRHESIQTLSQWYPALRFESRIIYNFSEFSNEFLGVLIFYHTNQVAFADWDPNEYKMFQIFYKMLIEKVFQLEQREKERQRVFQQLYKKQQQQQTNQQQIYFQNQGGNQNWDNQANNQWRQNFNNSQTFNGNQYQGSNNYNNQTHNYGYHNNHSQGFHNQQGNYSQHGGNRRQSNYQGGYKQNNKKNYSNSSSNNPPNNNQQYYQNNKEPETTSNIPPPPAQNLITEQPKPEPPRPTKFSITEIKNFIDSFGKEGKQSKNLTPELVDAVQKINKWKTTKETVDIQNNEPPQKIKSNKSRTQNQQGDFKKGGAPKRDDANMKIGGQFKKNDEVEIVFGKNETLAMRMKKREIQEQSQTSFATQSHKMALSLGEFQKQKRQIIFNLNLLAPENLREIERDIEKYLYDDEKVCRAMVEQIIEKAWVQPKYAGTYAKLCQNFSKAALKNFNYTLGDQKKSTNNPFKYILVQNVQKTFISRSQDLKFDTQDEKNKYLANTKSKIIGNVKFIAELIRIKVLAKKIAKFCISHLITTFLANHAYFNKAANFSHSYYDFYMEATIEFIENIGDKFQSLDEGKQKGEKSKKELPEKKEVDNSQIAKKNLAQASKIIDDLINEKVPELGQPIPELPDLTPDAYFKILMTIDSKILSKKSNRLSSLLKNLEERRDNGWQKHFVEAEGPKKLKQIKEEIAKQENQTTSKVQTKSKSQLEALNQDMQKMLEQYQNDDKGWQKLFKRILQYSSEEVMLSYLKIVAEEKKNFVLKRLEIFPLLMEKKLKIQEFKVVWKKIIQTLAFMSSDLPYCGASLAKILMMIDQKRGIRLKEFYLAFNEDEEEDEKWFMDEVFDKLYFYSQKEQIKEYVQVSKNPSNML